MLHKVNRLAMRESGMSLIELMVGLVIGLLATLAIMQTFSVFEGQKRSTSGSADAQTNGAIALMQLQRHLQTAGYGMPMPMADFEMNVLECLSADAADMFPVIIEDNGDAADKVIARYSTYAAGGGIPVDVPGAFSALHGISVGTNMGCNSDAEMTEVAYKEKFQDEDDSPDEKKSQAENNVMIFNGNQCYSATIAKQPNNVSDVSYIKLVAEPAGLPSNWLSAGQSKMACVGDYSSKEMNVDLATNTLNINGAPVVSGVVAMRAQYGVSSTASNNKVDAWVDAKGSAWGSAGLSAATPTAIANRNRIKAIRVAVVLRNGLKEKSNVTTAAPQAWGEDIDMTHIANWQQYRYRVYGTTIPLRNMIWSKEAFQ